MHALSADLVRAADRCIDERHHQFSDLGRQLFEQFGSDRGKVSTQVRNLQQIACSAVRFADIEDFVKNQMGKGEKWKAVGGGVLEQLSQLRDYSKGIEGDAADQMAVRLRLARGWARAVVCEYSYQLAWQQMESSK